MNSSKTKVTIQPPKLRNISLCGPGASHSPDSNAIWEIGVPQKNSLVWSIIMSYLYLQNDSDFPKFLRKLIGEDSEIEKIKTKKRLTSKPLNIDTIKQQMQSFNPFKNRHAFFHQAKEIIEVLRIFDLRLKQYGSTLRKKNDIWNDEFKLNAASLLLECMIEVHFPDETVNPRVEKYPNSSHEFQYKIFLFQYENQQHGSRSELINIFRFGMTAHQANYRKLEALNYFFKKANIPKESIAEIKALMQNSENHGISFLSSIFVNKYGDILQNVYKSPYLALRISEAGFETNPLVSFKEKVSAFGHSILNYDDSKYLSILYDYASNCSCLFDHSIRSASDDVMETLKTIKSLLQDDTSKLLSIKTSKHTIRATNVLKQFIAYAEYQLEATSELNNLKKNFESSQKTEEENFKFRKSVIESILTKYLHYFYCNLNENFSHSESISDKFTNYLQFSKYYKNVDNFAYISFFDNFYQLKLLVGLKQENVFLNIEWKIFVVILFCDYFSEFDQKTECDTASNEMKHHKTNVVQYIPLLHRNVLQIEIPSLIEKLKNSSSLEILKKSLTSSSSGNSSNALPQVIDVLLKIRLETHITTLEVPSTDNEIKNILVIERALQVIGESIKPPASNNGIISFLLRSCLPSSLKKSLVTIRNDLSHQRSNSIYGRLKIEKDFSCFQRMRKEILQIKQYFEIVFFTQLLRIEETAMYNCIKEIRPELEDDVIKAFFDEFRLRVEAKEKIYINYHTKCVQLLFNTLCDLKNQTENTTRKEFLIGQLKAIDYLLGFIVRHTKSMKVLNDFKNSLKVDSFISDSENKEFDLFKNDLNVFLSNWIKDLKENDITGLKSLSTPHIESFLKLLKMDLFSTDEEGQIKKALECAFEEANDASNKLKELFEENLDESDQFEYWLKQSFIPLNKTSIIRQHFSSKTSDKALQLINQYRCTEGQFEKDLKDIFQSESGIKLYLMVLLTKITYQKYINSHIYTTIKLSGNVQEKLEFFLTKRVLMLISRIKSLKCILIDEDEEIKETWIWGKSKEIKHHMRFLMRQRYMREVAIRAALDMAFFDCVNILHKPDLKDLYEKSTDLFSGIDLRNVLSHHFVPQTIVGILDEDDFPSAMISKMLELIDDLSAIESMLELLPKLGILEEKIFVDEIKNYSGDEYKTQIKTIRECERWEKYLFLFPFIRN